MKLERAEILTPLDSPAALEIMRGSDESDHLGDYLPDGTKVLVTDVVLPVRVSRVDRPRVALSRP